MRRVWSIDLSGVLSTPGCSRSTSSSESSPPVPPVRATTTIVSAFCPSGTNSLLPRQAVARAVALGDVELARSSGLLGAGLFGDRERQDALARGDRRQDVLLLRIVAGAQHRERALQVGEERRRQQSRGPSPRAPRPGRRSRAPHRRTPRGSAGPPSRAPPSASRAPADSRARRPSARARPSSGTRSR